jgi:hypothetical protein
MHLGHELTSHAPREFSMRLEHALSLSLMRLGHFICARACKKSGHNCLFLLPLWVKKLALLAQTQVETLTINTILPHLEFLIQNYSISRGR